MLVMSKGGSSNGGKALALLPDTKQTPSMPIEATKARERIGTHLFPAAAIFRYYLQSSAGGISSCNHSPM